jgi:uncharacterized protein YjdB
MNHLKRTLRTLFMGMGFLFVALLSGCGGGDQGRGPILGLPAADLLSIAVTPAAGSIPINGTQQYLATATFVDGSSRDVTVGSSWTSGTPAVATVNSVTGLATGVAAGSSVITASFGGKSGTANLTVTPATLVSMTLTPAAPSIAIAAKQQFIATGTFSDGTSRDITAISTFTSANTTVATIAAGGLATGVKAGTSVITAASGTRSAAALLTVTPATLASLSIAPANPSIQVGATRQLTVTATYSDATTVDVTANTAFTSAAPTLVTAGATTGLTTGIAVGSSLITGAFGGQTASTTVTVTPALLTSISVTPATATVAIAGTQKYVATGTFSNGTTADISATVAWTSSNTTVATVLPTGVATGQSGGNATITATSGALSGSAAIIVTPAVTLSSIAVTPATATVAIAGTQKFVATGTYSNGTTADISTTVTWASSNTSIATVGSTGIATGVSGGAATISATLSGKSGSGLLTVTPAATLTTITVTPANQSIVVGSTLQFTATGNYSNGTTADITNAVLWASSAQGVATILQTGRATAVATGVTNISATQGTISGSTSLTVTLVAPPPSTVALGTATSFAVLAGNSITNNSGGLTFVTGDVGSPSQTTPPVVAPGSTNYVSGGILAGALNDLQLAITDANSRTCTVSSASGIDLGGQTLPPGVYCYAGPISITGTLSLNGPGVYIFRTSSTLNSAANSIVALIGGATADNVFWVPVGATTLGANSVFKGSVLAQSSAITMGDTATLINGRVLSGTAVTLKNNVISR